MNIASLVWRQVCRTENFKADQFLLLAESLFRTIIGARTTEPATILSRIQKLYSSNRRFYSKKKLRAGKIDRSLLQGESNELFTAAIRSPATRDPYERKLLGSRTLMVTYSTSSTDSGVMLSKVPYRFLLVGVLTLAILSSSTIMISSVSNQSFSSAYATFPGENGKIDFTSDRDINK